MGREINITGFRPYDHQQAVINSISGASGSGKIVVCNSSRQKGKTYLVAGLLLFFSCNFPGTENFYIAPTLKQSKSVFKFIVDGIYKSGCVKSKNATDLIIKLINGSQISFKSGEQKDALRGFTADFLVVDEAAYVPDDVWHIVLPWTDARKAPVLLTSTPWIKQGFFHKYFCYGKEHLHNVETIDWSDPEFKESIELILPPERLAEYKEILPKNVFETDYLGHFLDDDGTVFTHLKDCIKYTELLSGDKLYVGIDWSNQGENDDTVISIFNSKGEQVFIEYFNKLTPLRQIDRIVKELEPINKQIVAISCETNSIGTPYTDLLKEKSQILTQKVRGFNTSNTSKNALVVNMQTALEGNKVWLLPDEKQKAQFGYFTCNYNPTTRNVSYAAPPGLNDDCVMATLLAYDCLKTSTHSGNYTVVAKSNKVKRFNG